MATAFCGSAKRAAPRQLLGSAKPKRVAGIRRLPGGCRTATKDREALPPVVTTVGSIWPVGAVRLVWTVFIRIGDSVRIGVFMMCCLGADFL
jgi:hypothetical protein